MKKLINVPDEAYVLVKDSYCRVEPCESCESNGSINLKGKNFVCPDCNGAGCKMSYDTYYWDVCGPATLSSVTLTKDVDGTIKEKYAYMVPYKMKYNSGKRTMKFDAWDVFSSYKAAAEEAERREYPHGREYEYEQFELKRKGVSA